jgi:L-ascorbate metabolism protein UlaG (beta-lactamase superfamily)
MGGGQVEVTWVGHATALIVIDGVRFLTDPALTPRIAHLRRHHPVDLDALAPDVVLISHVHLDHLHLPSLRLLTRDRSRELTIVVPAGAARLVRRAGFADVVETRVGDVHNFGGVAVQTVPAVHSGSRGPHSRVKVDAVGFVLSGDDGTVYFAGDTDLFDAMVDLANADVALVPIGGWGQSVGSGHLDAHTAVGATRLLEPRTVVPVHWGTYSPLSVHRGRPPWLARPAEVFAADLAAAGLDDRLHLLEPGGQLVLPAATRSDAPSPVPTTSSEEQSR